MAKVTPFEIYKSYRFALEAPDGGADSGCEQVWSDPFDPNCLWLVRGHAIDRETLDQFLFRCAEHGHEFKVRLLAQSAYLSPFSEKDRVIEVHFDTWGWLPFALDAKDSDVARDAVKLSGVAYKLLPTPEK